MSSPSIPRRPRTCTLRACAALLGSVALGACASSPRVSGPVTPPPAASPAATAPEPLASAAPTPTSTSAASPQSPPQPPVAAASPASATQGTDDVLRLALLSRLQHHFSRYRSGSDFGFFAQDFAPRVERFLEERDVAVAQLQRQARAFYAGKQGLHLQLEPESLSVQQRAGRQEARFVLRLQWEQAPPAQARSCGQLDGEQQYVEGPASIEHDARISVVLVLDETGRILSYEERGSVAAPLRVRTRGEPLAGFTTLPGSPARLLGAEGAAASIPDGARLEDLGDRFVCADGSEADTLRRVRFAGRPLWVVQSWMWNTGHSFVGDDWLVPETAEGASVRTQ